MPNGLLCFTEKLVLGCPVPWFWTLCFVRGGLVVQPCAAGAAFLVVTSLGRRPASVAGGGGRPKGGGTPQGCPLPVRTEIQSHSSHTHVFFNSFLNTFLVFWFFPIKRPLGRMNAEFCLWISLPLFGQITGISRTNYGLVGQITGAIHRFTVLKGVFSRTNYGLVGRLMKND
jgi:hypothetical protein